MKVRVCLKRLVRFVVSENHPHGKYRLEMKRCDANNKEKNKQERDCSFDFIALRYRSSQFMIYQN